MIYLILASAQVVVLLVAAFELALGSVGAGFPLGLGEISREGAEAAFNIYFAVEFILSLACLIFCIRVIIGWQRLLMSFLCSTLSLLMLTPFTSTTILVMTATYLRGPAYYILSYQYAAHERLYRDLLANCRRNISEREYWQLQQEFSKPRKIIGAEGWYLLLDDKTVLVLYGSQDYRITGSYFGWYVRTHIIGKDKDIRVELPPYATFKQPVASLDNPYVPFMEKRRRDMPDIPVIIYLDGVCLNDKLSNESKALDVQDCAAPRVSRDNIGGEFAPLRKYEK